jgi:YihY family inner membrane protein
MMTAPVAKRPNLPERIIKRLNHFQQRHKTTAFGFAVVKKFGDDEAAYQGALITYYGFLSLFPLLIVATSVIEIIARHNQGLQERLVNATSNYFPGFGTQLQDHVHAAHRSGIALVVGLLFTLYGARGGAAALQHALNHIWLVPRRKRAGFPIGPLKSLSIILVGGLGLLAAAFLSSYATTLNHSTLFKIVPSLVSMTLLFGVFLFIYKVGTEAKMEFRDIVLAAIVSAVGLQIIQTLGGYYVTHELKSLSALYGTFALVLGLLAWIYLQAQLMLYAVEISTVRALKLWPRSLDSKELTEADRRAYSLHAKKEHLVAPEHIDVAYD